MQTFWHESSQGSWCQCRTLVEMSLVSQHVSAMGFAELVSESSWSHTVVIALTISVMILRGFCSLAFDLARGLRRLLKAQHVDKAVQTEPYYSALPDAVWINEKSKVCHAPGCLHIGLRGKHWSFCTLCRNQW